MWVKQTSVKIGIKQRRVRKKHIFCFSTILVWTAPLPLLSPFLPPILSDLSPALSPQVLLHNLQMPRVNQPLSKCIENLNLTAKLETRYEYIAQSTSFLSASAKQAIQYGWIPVVQKDRVGSSWYSHRATLIIQTPIADGRPLPIDVSCNPSLITYICYSCFKNFLLNLDLKQGKCRSWWYNMSKSVPVSFYWQWNWADEMEPK